MTKQPPAPFNLGEFLPYRLSVLANHVSRSFAALYSKRFNLAVTEWRVLAVLGQQGGLSADQVCARTAMDKVGVSRAVTRLLDKGFVIREFARSDQRRSVLELSKRGFAIYAQIIPLAQQYEGGLLSNLTSSEQRQLSTLLDKLEQAAAHE